MNNNQIIWVLVPVYNVEKLLPKCINSIIRQTYTNWRMILVDDGSTDRSGAICDEYASHDSRITVVHTTNGGLPIARINGIKQTDDTGYCCFCDSDDEMPRDALQLLYSEAVRTNADLVCGNTQRILRGITISKGNSLTCFAEPKQYGRNEILSDLYLCCFGGGRFPVSMWGKLYRTSIVRSVMLNMDCCPKFFAEDLNVTLRLMPELKLVSVIKEPVYRYRLGGNTYKFMPTFLSDITMMYHFKMDFANKCTTDLDVQRLVDIEFKNLIVSYFIMCEKSQSYPRGSLIDEVKAVLEMDEAQKALTMLDGDRSGLPGINQPLIDRDYDKICYMIREKVKKDRLKDLIRKLLT